MIEIPQSFIDKFWSQVDKTPGFGPDGDCWEWTGIRRTVVPGGNHGRIYFPVTRKMEEAHRVSWLMHYGRWPNPFGLHRCDNPPCVRIEHLFEGTQADNRRDSTIKGRNRGPKGERSHNFRKTHCPRGHEYNPINTHYDKYGYRHCKACHSIEENARYHRLMSLRRA